MDTAWGLPSPRRVEGLRGAFRDARGLLRRAAARASRPDAVAMAHLLSTKVRGRSEPRPAVDGAEVWSWDFRTTTGSGRCRGVEPNFRTTTGLDVRRCGAGLQNQDGQWTLRRC